LEDNVQITINSSTTKKNSSIEKIPIRATILSACSVVPYLLILNVVYFSHLNKIAAGVATHVVLQLLVALRCPLTAIVTFKFDKKQTERNQQNKQNINQHSQSIFSITS
jgi:hypothetical protein